MIEYNELDDDIVPVIRDLNDKGYSTKDSCAGHPYKGRITQGYISFDNARNGKFTPKQKGEILEILHKHGVGVSPWMNTVEWDDEGGVDEFDRLHNIDAVRFSGIGKSRAGKWNRVRNKLKAKPVRKVTAKIKSYKG